jgi:hypothetical protein
MNSPQNNNTAVETLELKSYLVQVYTNGNGVKCKEYLVIGGPEGRTHRVKVEVHMRKPLGLSLDRTYCYAIDMDNPPKELEDANYGYSFDGEAAAIKDLFNTIYQ